MLCVQLIELHTQHSCCSIVARHAFNRHISLICHATKTIDVITYSVQTTPTHSAFIFFQGRAQPELEAE